MREYDEAKQLRVKGGELKGEIKSECCEGLHWRKEVEEVYLYFFQGGCSLAVDVKACFYDFCFRE